MTERRPALTMILAVARNGVIGHDGGIPWRIPEDMKHFKAATMGRTCIVGRRTWCALPPLPGRNVVLVSRTWSESSTPPVCRTVKDAIARAREMDPEHEPVVIGGAKVYEAAMPFVTRVLLTEIDADYAGDTVFHLDRTGFVETERRAGETPGVSFVTLERT